MPASSPGHSRDSVDDDIEVIAMNDILDKNPHSPVDSDDDTDDDGDVALLGHPSPRHHHTSSSKRLWPQIKGIVIEVRELDNISLLLLKTPTERPYITTHNREPTIHWKTAGSSFCEPRSRLTKPLKMTLPVVCHSTGGPCERSTNS